MRLKSRYFLVIVALFVLQNGQLSAGRVCLNEYGHFGTEGNDIWHLTHTGESNHSTICTPYGTLNFNFHPDQPEVDVILEGTDGKRRFEHDSQAVINLTMNDSRRHLAFFDGECLQVLNLQTGALRRFPSSIQFVLDGSGHPLYYSEKKLHYLNWSCPIHVQIRKMLLVGEKLVMATSNGLYWLALEGLVEIAKVPGNFTDISLFEDTLYAIQKVSLRSEESFTLYRIEGEDNLVPVDRVNALHSDGMDTHEEVRSPIHYYDNSFPSIARNGYAQVQEWEHVYLHPGVDLFEDPGTEVYSVADGVVRAILTTGDDQYWRIAIERFDVPGEGYLYAHLNENSFLFSVGDTVQAGDLIGTLFPAWGFSPHCHFARISPVVPDLWNGRWWVVDNPLVDITNMVDAIPPVFENAVDNQLFAFRTPEGVYLEPMQLHDEIDIVSRVVDYAAGMEFNDRIVPFDLSYRLVAADNPDSILYEQYCFATDMPLDTYFDLYYYTLVLNTIYSRDPVCYSTNNNQNRDFYFILTNSNGDSVITEEDSSQVFDTALLADGAYLLQVVVHDCAMNEVTAQMPVMIDNSVGLKSDPNGEYQVVDFGLSVFPNPANPSTIFCFSLANSEYVDLSIYNLQGQVVSVLLREITAPGWHKLACKPSPDAAGIYFARLSTSTHHVIKKLIILK